MGLQKHTNLAPVLAVIPAECYENPTWRGIVFLVRDWIVYAAIIAALAWTDHPLALAALWILSGMAISGLFILGHDAAHETLFKSRRLNYVLGQMAMLPSLHLYEAWVFGHNRVHHGHTTREIMDYVWHPVTPEQYSALSPSERFWHKVKWSWLGAGIYYGHEIWWNKMLRFEASEKQAPKFRRDRIVVGSFAVVASLVALVGGYSAYGSMAGALWMWTKTLAIPFVAFTYSIGFAVYVHHIAPDIRWHRRREWNKFKGQIEGTTILHIPSFLNFFYHNIFLHVAHHVDMRIPFYHLPQANQVIRDNFADVVRERDFRIADYLHTTRTCKLFDFETGRWCSYDGVVAEASDAKAAA